MAQKTATTRQSITDKRVQIEEAEQVLHDIHNKAVSVMKTARHLRRYIFHLKAQEQELLGIINSHGKKNNKNGRKKRT